MRAIAVVLVAMVLAQPVHAQTVVGPEVWHTFAARIEPGKVLKVRLKNGQRFRATLLDVADTSLTLQPKTRAAVPPQRVPYDMVETLEVDHDKGLGVVKAIAIGTAVAAGTFLSLMAIAFAAVD
jgi:hypothetical protein